MDRLAPRVATLLVAATLAAGCGVRDSGALAPSQWPGTLGIAHVTETGTPVGFGGPMMLINASTEQLIIEDVTIDRVDAGLEMVGWSTRDVAHTNATGVQEPYPPPYSQSSGPTRIDPSQRRSVDGKMLGETELVVGLRATASGRHSASGVRVRYLDGTGLHTMVFALVMTLCAPPRDFGRGCA